MKGGKILVTGSLGFIGTHLIHELVKDYKVFPWDLKNHDDIFDHEFEGMVKRTDIVYHLAALTSVDQSFKNPDKVIITNVLGTARVAYLCAKYKKKIIYSSSAAVYHKDLSPYAYTKYLADEIVRGIIHTTPVVILRLFNVFGKGMNPDTGSIMYNFLTDDKLIIYGDGEQTRDYIHVRDVVSIMLDAIKANWNGKIVDVGLGEAFSVNFVAGLFAFYRKKKLYYKEPRREIKWSIADTQILKTLYKKSLTTDIQDDIKELCANY